MKYKVRHLIAHKAFQNFIILGAIAVIQLGNNMVLGKYLSKDDFGRYTFIFFNIIDVLAFVCVLGQSSSILRFFSADPINNYKWKKTFLVYSMLVLAALPIPAFLIVKLYGIQISFVGIIVAAAFLHCITTLVGAALRSKGSFNMSLLIERAAPVILGFILVVLVLTSKITLSSAVTAKFSSYLFIIPVLVYLLVRWGEGSKKINRHFFLNGLAMWELGIIVMMLTRVDGFLIVKLLTYSDMALFGIMTALMQIFGFAYVAIFNVYSQKLSQNPEMSLSGLIRKVLIAALMLSSFYLIFSDIILDILFAGKYHSGIALTSLFCLYHSVILIYAVPACYIVAKSSSTQQRWMQLVNAVSIVIRIGGIFMLARFGLKGFVVAGIASMAFRTAGSYMLIFGRRRNQ